MTDVCVATLGYLAGTSTCRYQANFAFLKYFLSTTFTVGYSVQRKSDYSRRRPRLATVLFRVHL